MPYDTQSSDRPRQSNSDPASNGSQSPDQLDIFTQVEDTPTSDSVTHGPDSLPVLPPVSMPERFAEFHRENPHVYRALVDLARRFVQATGKRKLAVQRLVEIARWDLEIATKGAEEFEVNNSFGAYYSRLIMWQEKDLEGVFNCRVAVEADRWIALVKNGLVTL